MDLRMWKVILHNPSQAVVMTKTYFYLQEAEEKLHGNKCSAQFQPSDVMGQTLIAKCYFLSCQPLTS